LEGVKALLLKIGEADTSGGYLRQINDLSATYLKIMSEGASADGHDLMMRELKEKVARLGDIQICLKRALVQKVQKLSALNLASVSNRDDKGDPIGRTGFSRGTERAPIASSAIRADR
jgi:hypothetical protein